MKQSLQNDKFRFNMKKVEMTLEKATINRLDALLIMECKSPEAGIPPEPILGCKKVTFKFMFKNMHF
jgi:hypothetical protein